MKNLLLSILIIGVFASCSKHSDLFDADNALIESIKLAGDKIEVPFAELPGQSQELLNKEFPADFVSIALLAPELGYEVITRKDQPSRYGERSKVYFNLSGKWLKFGKENDCDVGKGCNKHCSKDHDGDKDKDGDKDRDKYGDKYGDKDPDSDRKKDKDGKRSECFKYSIPLSITFEEGSSKTLNDYHELVKLFTGAKKGKEFNFNYPITLQFDTDRMHTVQNDGELKRIYMRCDRSVLDPNRERERTRTRDRDRNTGLGER